MSGPAGGPTGRTLRFGPVPVPAPVLALVLGLGLALAALAAGPGHADGNGGAAAPAQPAQSLSGLLRTDALFAIIADEGAGYGREVGRALFAEGVVPGWDAAVARIYAPGPLRERFEQVLDDTLARRPDAREAAIAFLGSPPGQRITAHEIEARRALLDEAAAEAAAVMAERMQETRDPRLRRLRRLMVAGNLVEENTAAAMSGLLAFERGLQEAASPSMRLPEDQLAREIMAREAEIRAETTDWLTAFMALAYAGLDDADLDAYAEFAESPAGRAVNAAIFTAYAAALVPALHELGLEAGRVLHGSPI